MTDQEKALIKKEVSPVIQMLQNTKDIDVEKIGKLLEYQEKWEKMEAKKAYLEAFNNFKKNPPKIIKDKHVGFTSKKTGGTTEYDYTSLSYLVAKIEPCLNKVGLSISWKISDGDNGQVKVTVFLTHMFGHSESCSMSSAPDTSGAKNSIQAKGSAISFLKRYTLFAILGLTAFDHDDDGQSSELKEYITEEQGIQLNDLILGFNVNEKKFLNFMKVNNLAEIEAKDFEHAKTNLLKKAPK